MMAAPASLDAKTRPSQIRRTCDSAIAYKRRRSTEDGAIPLMEFVAWLKWSVPAS